MTGERLDRMGWPYWQPINVDFDANWNSPQSYELAAWWPFIGCQGGWPVLDRAFQRYPMTPFNTPTWVSDGEKGWSVLFDGVAEYLETTATPVTSVPLTISCWCYISVGAAGVDTLVCIGDASDQRWFRINSRDENRFIAQADGVAIGTAQSAAIFSAETWYNVVGVFRTSTDRELFVDGISRATNNTDVTPTQLDVVAIGARTQFGAHGEHFPGRIADVRIYNRALTDSEVFQLYANPWELYAPRTYRRRVFVAAAVAAPILTTYGGYAQPVG